MLLTLQRDAFSYFERHTNSQNGLTADTSRPDSPCSIAATGFALSCYPIAIEHSWISRQDAVARTLSTLRFFDDAASSSAPDATGYNGFFYHFLDMKTGQRAWKCELSSVDTALLLAGVLTAATYFDLDNSDERELRERAEALYRRTDWIWMRNGSEAVCHGWKPERRGGFLPYHWRGYNEALLLYVLALGSPTHGLPARSYEAWHECYVWKTLYGREVLYGGPLFLHQFPHCWLDLRGLQDAPMRAHQSDYFENSRRATLNQQEYARRNPRGFAGYEENCWGFTACDGPGAKERIIEGKTRRFWGYRARGAPWGADDGTLSPPAVVASLPFAPAVVLPALEHLRELFPDHLPSSFNPTFKTDAGFWVCDTDFGLDQGPMVLMIENYLSGLMWDLARRNPHYERGLQRVGFTRS